MPASGALRLGDVRAISTLVGECRELGDDAVRWRQHLLAGLGRLTGAGLALNYEGTWAPSRITGVVEWGWENGFARRPWVRMNEAFARHGVGINPMVRPYLSRGIDVQTRCDLLPDTDWYGSDYYHEFQRPTGGDSILYGSHPLPNKGAGQSTWVLVLPVGDGDFTARDRAVVKELRAAVAPLQGGPLAGLSEPSPSDLPPQARRVLKCFLEGDSDKQVSARLGLTRHTVNGYAKTVYRHFGVRSRAELLARWVRRGWGARFAWADE